METLPTKSSGSRLKNILAKWHERREQEKLYWQRFEKRRLAPSVLFDDSILDTFTINGIETIEAYYAEQVAKTGVKVHFSKNHSPE